MRPWGGLAITGHGVVSAAGIGLGPLTELVQSAHGIPNRDLTDAFGEPLPYQSAPVLTDFDVRAHLGRKGTNTYDRATGLAVVAAGEALRDAGIASDTVHTRVGVALGTTVGSLASISDFNRVILTKPKPYLVNPALFPNTVMNSATAQVAIRYGLRGVNSTIAGGALAFHQALRYAANTIDRGHAETMLVGAVEEFNAYRAWYAHRSSGTGTDPSGDGAAVPSGEGAAVFVVQRATTPGREATDGTAVGGQATILGSATGFGHGDAAGRALPDCVRRLLRDCRVDPGDVSMVLTTSGRESAAVSEVLGDIPAQLAVRDVLGDCGAATGGLMLAVLLATKRTGVGLLTSHNAEGGVAAALVRVRSGGAGHD